MNNGKKIIWIFVLFFVFHFYLVSDLQKKSIIDRAPLASVDSCNTFIIMQVYMKLRLHSPKNGIPRFYK